LSTPPPEAETRAPASAAEMFYVFNRLSLQGFGGVLPVAQRELVERERWMTRAQFVELLSIAQVLPGPNVVNLGLMLGDRHFGWRGAVASLAGLLLAPMVIVLVLAALYSQYASWPPLAGALHGMGAVAAGLVLSTACKLAPTLRKNPLGLPLTIAFVAATAIGVAAFRWPLVAVVLGLGCVSIALAWRRIKP